MGRFRVWVSSFGFVLLTACGGGGDNPPSSNPPTSPPTTPPATNPCAGVALESDEPAVAFNETRHAARKRVPRGTGDPRGDVRQLLWTHQAARSQGLTLAVDAELPSDNEDIGDVAVLQDIGDLIVRANPFDLADVALRFTPNASGGYDLSRADGVFRSALGNRLVLEDDDSSEFAVPFGFTFYGAAQSRAFVNSDGNITFGDPDEASTDRSVSRFLTGPPRVSPFFADLDPTTGSGRVFLATGTDSVTVTWCNVRGFDLTETVTVQTTMLPTGVVEIKFAGVTLDDAVVGLSPGRTGQFSTSDLSAAAGSAAASTALGERFSQDQDIDLVAVARKFYQSHPDQFDQLVIWTDTRVVSGNTFAFETTIANDIRGIGVDIFNSADDFGSAGRLRSLVLMDALTKYPSSPTQRFLGEDSTLSLLGHETGHRWLALLRFRDAAGRRSDELLGRDQAHWSFFFDSDASFMEGNDIEDQGGGAFRTIGAVRRYSLLDQYAMGLVGPSQVQPVFYVEAPTNIVPEREREDAPDTGVTFNGTKREVRIEDIVDVMGRREPTSSASPRTHRQAFVYIVSNGRSVDRAQVDKLEGIRSAWPEFFREATNRRMTLEARLP